MVAEQKARLPRERCVFMRNAFITRDGTARIRWRRLGAAFVVVAAMMCVAMCFIAAAMRLLIGDTAPPILMMLMVVPMTIGPLFALLWSISKIPQKPLSAAERQKVWKRLSLIALVFALLALCAYLFSCRLQPRTSRPTEKVDGPKLVNFIPIFVPESRVTESAGVLNLRGTLPGEKPVTFPLQNVKYLRHHPTGP